MRLYLVLAILVTFSAAFAVERTMDNPASERRAVEIFKNLKCISCEGQSILESDADFAKSTRALVREEILLGKSDVEIYDAIRSNYGNEIFYKPVFSYETILLWILPFLLLAVSFIFVVVYLRKSSNKLDLKNVKLL